MSMNLVGIVALLGGSELLGLLAGQWFYKLFLKTVPPLAVSSFSQSAAHFAFLSYGALLGLAIFGWALLAAFLARLIRAREESGAA